MELTKKRIDITTATDGSATVYSDAILGVVHAVQIDIGTLANTVDLTITCDASGLSQTLLALSNVSASAIYYPRVPGNKPADGTALNDTGYYVDASIIAGGRVKVVAAQGGNAKSGGVIVYYWE